ncbi:helix-turn-helix transcriptional regulator [Sporolactobacillus shoreicorticis]|uniref:Winged helix-turn-helix transcriptional regulator n=1 Tax=Sporolactobacillus shoreicorticis TaxID=1923877 RepID=A0ABW5S3V4_9BACL|nr:helix-turn-helix domain-containing protein [Sporolactobacillus shoreicorticis]MCO7127092.1 helix-turn-helix transcriptional regulator [Sporolactobacillus shoreicorticis]
MQRAVSVCPKLEKAFQILGKKWNGLIIEVLLVGETHFSTISGSIPELSDRMLSARLRELEEMGIIERIVDTGYPIQVTYRLTEMGKGFKPILDEVHNWANKWYGDVTEKK